MKKVLEVKNITKIYKTYKSNINRLKEIFFTSKHHTEFISNDNISFDLFQGETLGIIGVNGAGKSTILKIISGVVTQTSGEILKTGRVTALLELGTGFNQDMTGYENIFLNGTLIGMTHKECEDKCEDIIAFSELGDYINKPIKTYSSGMNMRLAFSIAIYSNPQILIVDEALSVGDAHFSAKCTKALKERKEQNMSIIYVSHDLNSLKLLCDRVILLDHGKVKKEGKPETVINHYNFLIAKLNDKEDVLNIDTDDKDSFGTFEVEIKNVNILKNNQISKVLDSGDMVDIEVEIYSKINLDNLTIGFHIRDKFSQDIYGTNTSLQKKVVSIKANTYYKCIYSVQLNIGVGTYSLGVALHTDIWHTDYCYHWCDNVVRFEITSNQDNSFIGLCRLTPTVKISEM